VYLTPELKTMLTAQVARVKALERTLGGVIPFLFPHLSGSDPRITRAPKRTVLGAPRTSGARG
jgi:hypothetical protein